MVELDTSLGVDNTNKTKLKQLWCIIWALCFALFIMTGIVAFVAIYSTENRVFADKVESPPLQATKPDHVVGAENDELLLKSLSTWKWNGWDNINAAGVGGQLLLAHVRPRVRADGLTVVANDGVEKGHASASVRSTVRALLPVSREMLLAKSSSSDDGVPLVYYEVTLKKFFPLSIGWISDDFPLNSSEWTGSWPGSYGIDVAWALWASGHELAGYTNGFHQGDVVGSGVLLITWNGRLKIFFTKNGQMLGKPIALPSHQNMPLLFPAVSFSRRDAFTSVEANFGADTAQKPFLFDVGAHLAELFNETTGIN